MLRNQRASRPEAVLLVTAKVGHGCPSDIFLWTAERLRATVWSVAGGDLHFLELRQAFERSGGLQHGEVIVVEAPASITNTERTNIISRGDADVCVCVCVHLGSPYTCQNIYP